MQYLHVYFNDMFHEQMELNKPIITIGRGEDNDLQIDNPGVSTHHARIVQDGEIWFIEDTESTNGTVVNGEPVSRQQLDYGDKIKIFKHTLRFSPLNKQAGIHNQSRHNVGLTNGAGTVEIDVSHLNKLLQQQVSAGNAYLLVNGNKVKQRRRPLNHPSFKIGKDPESDLVIHGWFVPRTIASIDRRGDGYYLMPKNGKTLLNDNNVQKPVKLENGDVFNIRHNEIRFIDQAEKATG